MFRSAADKHEAHERSAPVLGELAQDESLLTESLARHLRSAGILRTGNYPVVAIEIERNPFYELVANCWIPLPDRRTDISTKAIHHHGEMLLSTVTSFGPGYEHWMLARPQLLDAERSLYSMALLEHGVHGRNDLAFVDAFVAHVPLYPPSLTVTVCLWSSRSTKSWKDSVKRLRPVQRHASSLRRLGNRAGLAGALDLKIVDTFDFCPAEGGFVGLKERDEFPLGPAADYLQSLFHILQATGNEALAPIIEAQLSDGSVEDGALVRELLTALASGEDIAPRLSEGHYGVPHANFTRDQIEHALHTQPRE